MPAASARSSLPLPAAIMFGEGVKLLDEGNPRAALREFENTTAGASDVLHKADVVSNVAICDVRLGAHTAAIEAIAAAVALDPTIVAEFRTDPDCGRLGTSDDFRTLLRRRSEDRPDAATAPPDLAARPWRADL